MDAREIQQYLEYLTPQERAEMDSLIAAESTSNSDVLWSPDDPVKWIETEFFIPETNAAILLETYQKAVVQKALERDADGNFIYSLILWGDLKKSAKSTIAGAVDLWLAWHHEWETCRIVANDQRQAASRTFYYIERALKLNKRFRPHVKNKLYHIELDNNTTLDAIPVDPKGEAGGGDLVVTFTELWAAKNEAAKQLWTETTLSPLKYGKSLRWCESYAGFENESPILEQLYQVGVKQGELVDVGIEGLELYENRAARMLCLWNTVPRCKWQTKEYYAQESAALAPEEFNRIHGNIWASAQKKFVPIEWFDACKGELPPLRRSQSIVVALDAAVSNDCFGIVATSRTNEQVEVRYSRRWIPPQYGKLEYTDPNDKFNTEYPEGYLRWLIQNHNVVCVVYDEFQLHDFCTRLMNEGLGWFEAFPQGALRTVADKQLYDLIRERGITHDGDADLREHVQNADRTDEEDNKLRIVKRKPEGKVDLCVSLSMSAYQAKYLNIG